MKSYLLLSLSVLVLSSCEEQVYCDLSFQTVGFSWADSLQTPDRVDAVVRETQDSLFTQFEGVSGYYAVATDEHQSLFFNHSYHVDVYVYNSSDSLIAQNEWVVTADHCHIQKVSGPEILP